VLSASGGTTLSNSSNSIIPRGEGVSGTATGSGSGRGHGLSQSIP